MAVSQEESPSFGACEDVKTSFQSLAQRVQCAAVLRSARQHAVHFCRARLRRLRVTALLQLSPTRRRTDTDIDPGQGTGSVLLERPGGLGRVSDEAQGNRIADVPGAMNALDTRGSGASHPIGSLLLAGYPEFQSPGTPQALSCQPQITARHTLWMVSVGQALSLEHALRPAVLPGIRLGRVIGKRTAATLHPLPGLESRAPDSFNRIFHGGTSSLERGQTLRLAKEPEDPRGTSRKGNPGVSRQKSLASLGKCPGAPPRKQPSRG